MNPYDTPKVTPDSCNVFPLKKFMPPRIVILSITGIALTSSFGIAKIIYLAYQRGTLRLEPMGSIIGYIIGMTIFIGVIYLLLRGLYRGSKVAFWIVVVNSVLTIMAFKDSVNQFAQFQTQWEKGLFLFAGILQFMSFVALLFPTSWRWFHKQKNQEA